MLRVYLLTCRRKVQLQKIESGLNLAVKVLLVLTKFLMLVPLRIFWV